MVIILSGAGGYMLGTDGEPYVTSENGLHEHTFTTNTSGNNKRYFQPYYVFMFLIRYTTPLTSDTQLYGFNVYHVPTLVSVQHFT